jgi:hypothetical protein
VFSLLVGNENLQVIEIALTCGELARWAFGKMTRRRKRELALTVIAPRTSKQLFNVWMIALLLADHLVDLGG